MLNILLQDFQYLEIPDMLQVINCLRDDYLTILILILNLWLSFNKKEAFCLDDVKVFQCAEEFKKY